MDSAPGTPPVVAARHSASDGLFRTAHARRVRVPCRRVPGQIGMGFSVSNGDLPSRGEECNPLTGLRPARDRPVRAQTRQARTLVWDHSGTDRNPRIRVQRPIRSGRCYAGSGATPVPAEPGATDTIPPRRGFRGAMEFRPVGTRTRAVSSASRPNGCPGTRRACPAGLGRRWRQALASGIHETFLARGTVQSAETPCAGAAQEKRRAQRSAVDGPRCRHGVGTGAHWALSAAAGASTDWRP